MYVKDIICLVADRNFSEKMVFQRSLCISSIVHFIAIVGSSTHEGSFINCLSLNIIILSPSTLAIFTDQFGVELLGKVQDVRSLGSLPRHQSI